MLLKYASIIYRFLDEQEFVEAEGRILVEPRSSARELATETCRLGFMSKKIMRHERPIRKNSL